MTPLPVTGCTTLQNTLASAVMDGLFPLAAGVVVSVFLKSMAPPFYAMAASTTLVSFAITLIDSNKLVQLKKTVASQSEHLLHLILAVALLVAPFLPITGLVLGGISGYIHSVKLKIDETKAAQNQNETSTDSSGLEVKSN